MILSMSKVKLRFNTTFYWDCSANLSLNFLSLESDIGTQIYMEWNKSLCELRSIRYRIDLTAPPCIFIMIPSDSNSLIQILSVTITTLSGLALNYPRSWQTSYWSSITFSPCAAKLQDVVLHALLEIAFPPEVDPLGPRHETRLGRAGQSQPPGSQFNTFGRFYLSLIYFPKYRIGLFQVCDQIPEVHCINLWKKIYTFPIKPNV